ncbi:MAG: chemotaxis protein CheW [Anaerolineae bacterium]|nr:chemotaxis protein CheW [Anaerolineae bacterium]
MATTSPDEAAWVAHLIFKLDQQHYALAIGQVVEVAAMVDLVATPDVDEVFLGVANRHGTVLPMLDLRPIFRQPVAPVDTSTLFIVARADSQSVGLVVDEVLRIEYFDLSQAARSTSRGSFLQGIVTRGEQVIQLVALASLLAAWLPQDIPADFEGEQAT